MSPKSRCTWFRFELLALVAVVLCGYYQSSAFGMFDFPKPSIDLSYKDKAYLNSISLAEWQKFVQLGTDSANHQKRLEANLLSSEITVENGSISHAQLLDTLPNSKANEDNDIALKILKSSLYVYNTKCAQHGINGVQCEAYLAGKMLPENSELLEECANVLQSPRDGHHAFRRLLPRNYKDGFYEMYSEEKLPAPRLISSQALPVRNAIQNTEWPNEGPANLALVQWTQFIEHDLSKPVVPFMSNGYPIECCNREHYQLQPRFHHPACAPLVGKDPTMKYGRETCLNYVRSALAVGSKCTFGAAEQLNQASGYLDLSQLYGFTDQAQHRMRSYRNGQIKSTPAAKLRKELLAMVTVDPQTFCALKYNTNDTACFLAGDSRVNSNPLAIVLYTIFMRNHNQIANKLKSQHAGWEDDRLFQTAKDINIDIYRRIVFNEWLPELLGESLAAKINREPLSGRGGGVAKEDVDRFQISNEFAIAALRFYFSMMPNVLHNFATATEKPAELNTGIINNNILAFSDIFAFKDQIFTPKLKYTSSKLDEVLESLMHQRAMKMDGTYVESLIPNSMSGARPTHADILAVDIQRGRDHGLQGYVKYLEICANTKINKWTDLEKFIAKVDINQLKDVYSNWSDIDLIVGGISELPTNNSTVGPTFSCILAEQFSKMRQWQHLIASANHDANLELLNFKAMTAADLLCDNSDLQYVTRNIFQLDSEKNPLISCGDRVKVLSP